MSHFEEIGHLLDDFSSYLATGIGQASPDFKAGRLTGLTVDLVYVLEGVSDCEQGLY